MSQRSKQILFIIFVVAFVMRLWFLSSADMLNDEVYYSVRSIGYLDYGGMEKQTTPLDWFYPLPSWTKLSFHDHPPLVFFIAHIFFRLFGSSLFVARLPFALAGIICVFLVFLIAKKLFDEKTGLAAAGLAAVFSISVWISRVALMESMVIMFVLLAWYLFLLALENGKYWYFWAVVVGLSFLAKYTAFPIMAVFLIYLFLYKREVFRDFRFYAGLAIVVAVFSPAIIYNIFLFNATGHFDLQIAALLGQDVLEWQTLDVKLEGSWLDKLLSIPPALLNYFSPATLSLLIIGVLFSFFWWLRKKQPAYSFLLLFLIFYLLLFVLIKPLPRFISMLWPFIVILIAALIVAGWRSSQGSKKIILSVGVLLFLVYETLFSINTNLTVLSLGLPNLTFSSVRAYSADFAVNKLDSYLNEELKDMNSAVIPQSGKKSLDEYITRRANQAALGKAPSYVLLVYDPRLYEVSTLWLFERRFIYQAIPSTYADDFTKILEEKGAEAFSGYNIYYITGTAYALWRRVYNPKTSGVDLEQRLVHQGLEPEIISNSLDVPIFKVYKFSL